jgi:hypothetical protein
VGGWRDGEVGEESERESGVVGGMESGEMRRRWRERTRGMERAIMPHGACHTFAAVVTQI